MLLCFLYGNYLSSIRLGFSSRDYNGRSLFGPRIFLFVWGIMGFKYFVKDAMMQKGAGLVLGLIWVLIALWVFGLVVQC